METYMIDDDQPLPDLGHLVIRAKADPFGGAAWPAASPCGAQRPVGDAGSNLDAAGLEHAEHLSPSGPRPDLSLPLRLPDTPAAIDNDAPVKLNGRVHPWKPRTPAQKAEFTALWKNLTVPLAAIAKRYKAGERTVQVWRRQFGLLGRDELARAREQGTGVQAVNTASTAEPETGSVSIMDATFAPASSRPEPPATGAVPMRPSDPLSVPEIAALLAEVRDDARKMTAVSDLRPLRRKLAKLAALASASTPHNWASLHAMAQEQARALLWAETCEAKLPKAQENIQQLRVSVAGQMMRELKSVLNPEEQAVLARVMQAGADRLMAKGGQASVPNDLPGAPGSYAHNGKDRPQVKPG